MKLKAACVLLLVALPCFGQSRGTTNDTLKVVTFNLFGRPSSEWPLRQTMVLNELTSNPPDLIGLQEVIEPGGNLDHRAKRLADSLFARTGLKYDFVYQQTHFSWNQWFEGIAILTPHIILDSEARALPSGLFPRAVVWLRALTPAGIVNYFDTHLSFSNQEPVRIEQVAAIREFVVEKSADGAAVANIVVGDFNAIPDSPPILNMTNPAGGGIFIDTWAEANPGDPGFTVPSDNPDARIDYIFVRDDAAATVLSSVQVFEQSDDNGIFPSDHIGVMTELATTNRKVEINLTSPANGEAVAGETNISWELGGATEPMTIRLFVSPDVGATWQQRWTGSSSSSTFAWNTLTGPDGARYLVRVVALGDTSFGMGQMDSTFTVNNPGNAAPELELQSPRGGGVLKGAHIIKWQAVDAESDPLTVSIDLSSDGGASWLGLATDEVNDGSFVWDTNEHGNSSSYKLRVNATDGAEEVSATSGAFAIQNDRTALPESYFDHIAGTGHGSITAGIIDSTKLTGHLYRLTFNDTTFENTSYDVYDANTEAFVVRQAGELGGVTEGPAFDGMRLLVSDFAEAQVDANLTGWTKGASTLGYKITAPSVLIDGETVESIRYPADYTIALFDTVVDSTAAAFGFEAKAVKFAVWNVTQNRKSRFLFTEFFPDQTISDFDQLTILETDESDELRFSWSIFFEGSSSHVPPVAGDEFTLATLKPFTSRDIFEFRGMLPTSVFDGGHSHIPQELTLFANYPNPFNPETTISYLLPAAAEVELSIYNLLGQEIVRLVDFEQSADKHAVRWDGRNKSGLSVSSGVYFYKLVTGGRALARKMLMIK